MQTIIRRGDLEVTLPDDVQEVLGFGGGETVSVELTTYGAVLRRKETEVDRIAGIFAPADLYPVPTDEELDDAFEQGVADDVMGRDAELEVDRLFGSLASYRTGPSLSADQEREAFETGVAAEIAAELAADQQDDPRR